MTIISNNLSKEMNKALTKQCKSIGYRRSDILAYMVDNPNIVDNICNELLKSDMLIEVIQHTTGINMTSNAVVIRINTDNSLTDILSKYNITVSSFLYYIIRTNTIYEIKDVFPEELKLKKYR